MTPDQLYVAAPAVSRTRSYFQLLKARLSGLVAFSAALSFLMGSTSPVNWAAFWATVVGGFAVTGAANIINQIIEKDLDRLMQRTADRPLPTGRLTVKEAGVFALILAFTGLTLMAWLVNLTAALLTLISLILYGFIYTPLKQRTSLAVLVGAFPGALPPLIGWVAATGEMSMGGLILFAIQFMWQFPHFWAIAWVGDEDYRRAGFRLLPNGGERSLASALHIVLYTVILIPLGWLPLMHDLAGPVSAVIATLAGFLFLWPALQLVRQQSRQAALRLMFGSFLYLPLVQIAYLLDKV